MKTMKKITFLLIALLVATIGYSQTTIFSENFDAGTAPTDWVYAQSQGTGDTFWTFGSGVVPGSVADFSTNAAIFDDDAAGNDSQHDNVYLWYGGAGSTGFDLTAYGQVTLTYDYAFNLAGTTANAQTLSVSIWDSTNTVWIPLKVYGEDTDPTTDSVDITAAINANPGVNPTAVFIGFGYDDIDGSWGWGAGIDNVVMTGSPQPAHDSIFVHTATSANTSGYITTISHPDLDGNPDAKIVVTHNWNPNGTNSNVYNNNIDGVWYNGSNWTIYNEDYTTPMVAGASFNVYIRGNDSNVITQIATVANQNGTDYYSFIDNPITNGNPNANLVMDNYFNPNSVYINSNYGFYYNTTFNQWAIYSESHTPIPVGAAFNVIVEPSNDNVVSFRHQATTANTAYNLTMIDHPLLNGKPNAVFVFSHNWGSGGDSSNMLIDKVQGVYYYGSHWYIYNEDLSAMDVNSLYNIVVMTSEVAATDSTEFTNFTAYPNPVKDVLNINAEDEITKIEVYNLLGQQVKSSSPKARNFTMDLSDLNAGMYTIKFTSNDKYFSKKIIKQ